METSISSHFIRLLKYLSSDLKNIKLLLQWITLYIKNKSIDCNKANNVMDLKSIGNVAWNFISILYESGWDSLIADKDNYSFRQKVVAKFTPKLYEINI